MHADEPALHDWPLPYAALAWVLRHTPDGVFLGNPRIHYQHLADRMNAPRREQRRWRAWACWALSRAIQPGFPADPLHPVVEPSPDQIVRQLRLHGLAGEDFIWQACLSDSRHSGSSA